MQQRYSAAAIAILLLTPGCACHWPTDHDLRTAATIVRTNDLARQPLFPLPTGCDKIRVYYDRKQEGSYTEFQRVNGRWEAVGEALVIQHSLGYGSDDE
jgi:hypothetical protein